MGNKIGKEIKVDPTTLKKESGFYASVLIEIDLAKSIPSKILVELKYGKFEQVIQIPKLPRYCNHCKIVGHHIYECRTKRKEDSQQATTQDPDQDFVLVKQKKQWKPTHIQLPNKAGFDICFGDISGKNMEQRTNSVSGNLPQGDISSRRFHILQNPHVESGNTSFSSEDFPALIIDKSILSPQNLVTPPPSVSEVTQDDNSNVSQVPVAVITSKILDTISKENNTMSSSEDGEIKEVSVSSLIHQSSIPQTIFILKRSEKLDTPAKDKFVANEKKAPPIKKPPLTRKQFHKSVSQKGNSITPQPNSQ
ncbi:uncharacterized protein LOC113351274 [Papaver somniferum]|uniref:uncharacterized protein LOC113351274 n=1 Tax=Papaver somniferum TaxID=3469 RepID=UPI000E6F49E8|nr:uncharacterized protein LOC113351274 [Papaver somniferum]